jgi:hypothetical protein
LFHFKKKKKKSCYGKEIKTITSYQSTITATDIFHDIHMPVDKTSIATARGSTVVSGMAVSKNKFQNKITFLSYLPTLFFCHVIGNQQFES